MIVDSMTLQEICEAVLQEKDYVDRVETYRKQDFIKAASKAKNFPFYRTYTTRTAVRKTEFRIASFCVSKKYVNNPSRHTYAVYERPEGRYVAFVEGDWKAITIFTPHFFQRYREREIKDYSISTNEVIDRFFRDFRGFCDMWVDDSDEQIFELSESGQDGRVNLVGALQKGVLFGFTEGKVTLAKTFVSYDMLHEKQIKRFDKLISEFARVMKSRWGESCQPRQ